MYRIFFIIFVCISAYGYAQNIKGEFDVAAYPKVSFVWNEYDPEIKDTTQFLLTGDREKIPFQLQHLPIPETSNKDKSILFLWEDLNHTSRNGQAEFTQQLLYRFLQQVPARKGDKFNIAVFDRKGGNDSGSSIHTLLSDGFTSDREQLAEAVRNFSSKYDLFSDQVNSELYMAIEEGIDLLKKESADRIRVLVVITAGSNQDRHGGQGDFADVKATALKIPIYLVKYPIAHCEHCTNIDGICARTFGKQIEATDTTIAETLLLECFHKMNERHYGQDYRVTFHSQHPYDGKPHLITWSVNGKEYTLTYVAPPFSVIIWAKEHKIKAILVGTGCLLLIATAVFFIFRAIKKSKIKRECELEALQQRQRVEQQLSDNKIHTLEECVRKTMNEQKMRATKNQEAELTRIMQNKNLFPRLQYTMNGNSKIFNIYQPITTIGRDADNQLIFSDKSVSRHHAKVVFSGVRFEIQDLGSTNKVIVNGQFVQQAILNNGDIIGLGKVVLYFYN
jgi:hypothetical protein